MVSALASGGKLRECVSARQVIVLIYEKLIILLGINDANQYSTLLEKL